MRLPDDTIPFLVNPSGQESNHGLAEERETVILAGEVLVRQPDLARCLLDVFGYMRQGGILRIHLPPRLPMNRPLTSWTEIVAELLYPQLADLRLGALPLSSEQPVQAWYGLSPATLRAFVRKIFGERLELVDPPPPPEASGNVLLVWRKAVPLASAFPWRIGESWPEILVELSCGPGESGFSESGPRLQVVTPQTFVPYGESSLDKGQSVTAGFAGTTRGLSVIMATRNVKDILAGALCALAAQSRPPLELVVQDGASTDGTQACLENLAKELPFPVRVESCPDGGVYDAWNRALDRAHGDWLLFLGADDRLHEDVLARALPLLEGLTGRIDLAYGSLEFCRAGKTAAVWAPQPAEALARMHSGMGLPFPATFIRSSVFTNRRFDPSYRIAGDFRLLAEVAKPGNLARLPICVTRMELGGLSSNPKYHTVTEAERIRVLRELAFLP